MDSVSIITAVALFLSLLYIANLFFSHEKTKKKLNLPPSPPSRPITGHLHHVKRPLHQSLARLSAHGPILLLRFGNRRVLSVSSGELADECFTTNDVTFAGRPRFPSSRFSSYNHTTIPTSVYGPYWREMRRIATVEALSGHRLAFFSDIRAHEVRSLARTLFLDSAGEGGGFAAVELRPRLFGLAMNVIMGMIAGKRYYGVEDGEEEARRFRSAIEKAFSVAGASNVGDFLPSALGWVARRRVSSVLARVHNYREEVIQSLVDERRKMREEEEERKEERSQRTMMDALLAMQQEQPDQYTDRFIKAIIESLLSAGTDTSSQTSEWAMSLLLNNPEKLDKVRKEIDEEVGHGRLLEESDLAKLPYLHCIITETLRLYPVAPLLVPHESTEDCKVGGYDIPRRTILLVNVYVIHRDPKVWPEPAKFLPERFEEEEGKTGKMMLPFGLGRRKCPGEGLAMREVGLVLGTLIQCFEWRRVGEDEVDMEEGGGITMPKAKPLQAMYMARECMISVLSQL